MELEGVHSLWCPSIHSSLFPPSIHHPFVQLAISINSPLRLLIHICLSTYLPTRICLPLCPSICPHTHLSNHLSIYPCAHLSIHHSFVSIQPHTSVHLSIERTTLSVNVLSLFPIYPSSHPSNHLPIYSTPTHSFIHPSIYLSTHPPAHPG